MSVDMECEVVPPADSAHDDPADGSGDDSVLVPDSGVGDPGESDGTTEPDNRIGHRSWQRLVVFGVLPAVALLLALGAGYLKWRDGSTRDSRLAQSQSLQAAVAGTAALLSYQPDSVQSDLGAAGDRLSGAFKDSYAALVRDVVIPGAKQKRISAVATVPAAASASATEKHAVVLVFVNQETVVGNDAPVNTVSSIRVSLDKIGDRWLISGFEPGFFAECWVSGCVDKRKCLSCKR